MGKGNGAKLENTTNRHADSIDRALNREKRMKENGTWREPVEAKIKHPDDMTFRDNWPQFSKWQRALDDIFNLGNALSELRDYCDMKGPQEPLLWVKDMYNQEIEPKQAKELIRTKLHW